MLDCLFGPEVEGALSLSSKGIFNISKLNDVSWERITQSPTISAIIKFSTSDNPLPAEWVLRALIDFTLSNASRFYSVNGEPLRRERDNAVRVL